MATLATGFLCKFLVLQAASDQQVQELVEKLKSENAKERDLAGQRLRDLGSVALPELRKAVGSDDPVYGMLFQE